MKLIILLKNGLYVPIFLAGIINCKQEIVEALLVLMIIDIITGIIKSIRINGTRSIKSIILVAGFVSKILLILIPVILAYTGQGIGIDLKPLVSGTMMVLVVAESYSSLGNIQAVRIGKDVPEFDIVSFLIKKIRKQLLRILEKSKEK